MNKYYKFFALLLLIFNISICAFAQKIPPAYLLDTTTRGAIDFKLIALDDQVVDSDNLKGSVVVINFWGIYCKPCIQEIPELNKMVQEFRSEHVHFIGITGDSKKEIINFLNNHPFEYKIYPTSDYTDLRLKFNSFPAVPIHIIINKDWKIIYRFIGKLEGEHLIAFKQKIREAL